MNLFTRLFFAAAMLAGVTPAAAQVTRTQTINVDDAAELRALPAGALRDKAVALIGNEGQDGVFVYTTADLSAKTITRSDAIESVNTSTDVVTIVAHGFKTGDVLTASVAEAGLAVETLYYVARADADTFTLHASIANALAGTSPVNITASTTQTINRLADPAQGIYVIPSGDALDCSEGCWVRRFNVLNPRFFGAEGEGADEWEPLQRALDFMLLSPNAEYRGMGLYFPPGKSYETCRTLNLIYPGYGNIPIAFRIFSDMANVSSTPNAAHIRLCDSFAEDDLFYIENVSDVEFDQIILRGAGAADAGSILIDAYADSADVDLLVTNTTLYGAETAIKISGRGMRLFNSNIVAVANGVEIAWPSPFTPGANPDQTAISGPRSYDVQSSRFHGNSGGVMVINRGASAHYVRGINILDNTIDTNMRVFRGHANDLTIAGNKMINSNFGAGYIVEIEDDLNAVGGVVNHRVNITNNIFGGMPDNGSGVTYELLAGFLIYNTDGLNIHGNQFYRVERTTIQLVETSNFDISGNVFFDTSLDNFNATGGDNGELRRPILLSTGTAYTNGIIDRNRIINNGAAESVQPIVGTSGATLNNVFIGQNNYFDTAKWHLTDRVTGNFWQVISASLADDSASCVNLPGDRQRLLFDLNVGGSGAYRYARGLIFQQAATNAVTGFGSADIEFTTGALTGTTGTDAKATISVYDDSGTGKLCVENRLGTAQPFSIRYAE